jgi:LCP family protein required for cell wall assembly
MKFMESNFANLLSNNDDKTPVKSKRPFFLFGRFILLIVIATILVGLVSHFVSSDSENVSSDHPTLFSTVKRIVTSADRELDGEDSDRINFLVLGIGGEGHDGPELTDTIIFASVRPSTEEVGMMSIPRDLSVPIEGYGWQKINHVNAYGEQEDPGSGAGFAAETAGEILDQKIHYWIKVDFQGFEDFIDAIGGLDIDVERAFTDSTYPIDDGDGTVITLDFEDGLQHMDGETALRFARSRHGDNNEGSDFARAARQQKIILAVKKKLLSPTTLLNPTKIAKIIDTLKNNIQTNISTWEMMKLANIGNIFDSDRISNVVLTTAPGSPLYETYVNEAYVILPRNNDWTAIQKLAKNIFNAKDEIVGTPDAIPRNVRIEVQNATDIDGLAKQTCDFLAAQGYEIVSFGNSEQKLSRTIIYDLSNGSHRTELIALQDYLSADVSLSAPGWLLTQEIIPDQLTVTNEVQSVSDSKNIDFLIILGQSSANIIR